MAKQKVKIPKRIAGMKLKKPMRKKLGAVVALLNTNEGRALLGSAAGAVMGVLSQRGGKQTKH